MKDLTRNRVEWTKSGQEDCKLSPRNGFLRLPQVLELIPVSKTTWWDGIKAGRYPKGVKIAPRVTAWRMEEVDALIKRGPASN